MIRICILDDDSVCLNELDRLLNQYMTEHKVAFSIDCFGSSDDFLKIMNQGKLSYQLYFLDIVMPGTTGIEIAKEIRKSDRSAHIIFLTSSPEYALEGYEVRAFYCLHKALGVTRLFSTLSELLGGRETPPAKMFQIKTNGVIRNIPYQNICYIEARRNKLFLVLNNGETVESYGTFSGMVNLLKDETEFTQTHRSFLINMRYIREFASTTITLQSDYKIPVSRNYVQTARQNYFDFAKNYFS